MNKNELPILAKANEIIASVRENQVTVVTSETGSGKTTQIPQLLYAEGLARDGVIAVTEPRRIAASSVARFIAGELGVTLGEEVGYKVRFDDKTSPRTVIKFLTDGMLLSEMLRNPDLTGYSIIMVDEAHERNTNIDLIFGLLKRLVARRPDMKVVISSATIDTEKFSRYFGGAPVVEAAGRLYPVSIHWSGADVYYNERSPDPDKPVVDAVVAKIVEIHLHKEPGDILVFVPGADTIGKVLTSLEEKHLQNIVLLPAHGGLSPDEQAKIFTAYTGERKVVVATNIAETSITIDGVVYVVDSGLIKETHFSPLSGIPSLDVVPHSQAGCNQRAGRAGRTKPGVCFRLYSEASFNARPLYTEPEIKRTGLASLVLQMEAMGIANVPDFDFLDPPAHAAFLEAYNVLEALGAIRKHEDGVPGGLTDLGKAMAELPLEPTVGRMLLEAEKHGCVQEVATIAAFLSVTKRVLSRPRGKEEEADAAHAQFKDPDSDMLTFLAIWEEFNKSGRDRDWCRKYFLNPSALWEAKNIREQILRIFARGNTQAKEVAGTETALDSAQKSRAVLKAVAAGLIWNLFRSTGAFSYVPMLRVSFEAGVAFVHPGSAMARFGLFARQSPWLVASELVRTKKLYMRGCSEVEPRWLPDLLPSLFSWGIRSISSYTPGDETAEVKRPVLYARNAFSLKDAVHWEEEDAPLAVAQEIQKERVEAAKREGLVLLKVEESIALRRFTRLPNTRVIARVESSWADGIFPQDGEWHYCSVSLGPPFGGASPLAGRAGGSLLEHPVATPRFRVFDLDDGVIPKENQYWEESLSPQEPPPSQPQKPVWAAHKTPPPAVEVLPAQVDVSTAVLMLNQKFSGAPAKKQK